MEPEIENPGIVKALRFFAWVSIVASPIIGFVIAGTANMADAPGLVVVIASIFSGIFSGTVFFGFAAVIMKLFEIENHLRSAKVS